MSRLTVYADDGPDACELDTADPAQIAASLAEIGVVFEQWQADVTLAGDATDGDVLSAYARDVARLADRGGYRSKDVVRMLPDNPQAPAMRAKFLAEHVHSDDEVRFFVEGEGLFCLRAQGRVYAVLCTAGDLISVPAGTRHWFDMGADPRFTAIRLFITPDGWVADFTGDPIADRFPGLVREPA